MKDLKFFEIIKQNKILEKELKAPLYNITIISNIVINQIKDVISFYMKEAVNSNKTTMIAELESKEYPEIAEIIRSL